MLFDGKNNILEFSAHSCNSFALPIQGNHEVPRCLWNAIYRSTPILFPRAIASETQVLIQWKMFVTATIRGPTVVKFA